MTWGIRDYIGEHRKSIGGTHGHEGVRTGMSGCRLAGSRALQAFEARMHMRNLLGWLQTRLAQIT